MKKSLLFVLVLAVFAAAGFSQVAHWPLDSDTRDVVGINHGTPTLNGVSFVNDPSRGDVMLLDGVEGFVTLPSDLFKDMDNATLTCWFNFTGGAVWQRVWSFGHIDDPWAQLYFTPRDGDGNMRVTILGLGREWRDHVTEPIDTMVWHFAAAVFDADTFKFFLDDEMVVRNDSLPATPNEVMCDPNEAYLGKSHWPDATFNGMIDDVRIYDSALSDEEVLALYDEGNVSVPVKRTEPAITVWAYDGMIRCSGADEAGISQIKVYSLTGQLVLQSEELSRLNQVRFDPGLYVVNLTAEEGIISKKVLITD